MAPSPGVPHQTASHLDQLDLHAPQRPVLDRLGQTQPAKEVPKVVRQDEQRQTHPVGHEPMARQPSPVEGVLALLDPLLGCPSTIVETHHSFGASRHVHDDEAHPREQLSPMPLPPLPPPAVPGPNSRHDTKSRRIGSLDASAASPQVVSAKERSRIAALCCSAAVLRRRLAAPPGTRGMEILQWQALRFVIPLALRSE